MNIVDWFDLDNIEHLKAYRHLGTTGMWPKDFLPGNIVIKTGWNFQLMIKIADRFIKEKLQN